VLSPFSRLLTYAASFARDFTESLKRHALHYLLCLHLFSRLRAPETVHGRTHCLILMPGNGSSNRYEVFIAVFLFYSSCFRCFVCSSGYLVIYCYSVELLACLIIIRIILNFGIPHFVLPLRFPLYFCIESCLMYHYTTLLLYLLYLGTLLIT